jgi:hypothetical protein
VKFISSSADELSSESPKSFPTEEFMWWRMSREVNRADPNNNRKELLEPVSAPENA